jgi:hypothetical protein
VQLHLKSGFRRVWRETGTLQIGLSRQRGTVLHGLTAEDVPLLEGLGEGIEADVAPRRTERERELLHLLADAGVLTTGRNGGRLRAALGEAADRLTPDAAVWSIVRPGTADGWSLLAARAGRRVVVRGGGRLGSTLAATLSAAGVGDVRVDDRRRVTAPDLAAAGAGVPDLGRIREEAVMDAVRRAAGRPPVIEGAGASPPERSGLRAVEVDKPDLVILVEPGAADADLAGRLVSADIPHLSVVVQEDVVLVGPLVRPGVGPCLRCLDLHRGDRDPAWPAVLDQVLGAGFGQPEENAVATLAAGLATLQVLAFLDGLGAEAWALPASAGATLEIELPDGLIARRTWPAHPRCGCHWPPSGPVEEAVTPGTGEDEGVDPGRMKP